MARRHRSLATSCLVALSLPVIGVAAADSGSAEVTPHRFILRVSDPAPDSAVMVRIQKALQDGDGRLVSLQAALGTVVVEASPQLAEELDGLAGVTGIAPDAKAKSHSLGIDPAQHAGSLTNITRLTGAQTAWKQGYTGEGVDIALVDTGVAPVPALSDPDKVVVGPDLSFESQAENLRYLDTYGHGTHMASIIAGREVPRGPGADYAADQGNLYGMAPDSRLVSVKVGDHNGVADVSQLIAAIDWVVQNRRTADLNIRVLNLSFGTDSQQSSSLDPLSYAAEVAWDKGIFVVVSAGNDGRQASGLANPAYNPQLMAVGAVDTLGTDSMSDDVVPRFSQHPRSSFFKREPDLVAPGVGVLASGVPGSMIVSSFPGAVVGDGLLRGSGTSQSAAIVSGAAALLLDRSPRLSPNTLKNVLTGSATPLRNTSAALQGDGELNLTRALSSRLLTARGTETAGDSRIRSSGIGSLERARGSIHVTMDRVVLMGERDIMGQSWSGIRTASLTSWGRMWSEDGRFNGAQWTGADGFVVDTTSWAGRTWQGRTWQGRTWAGNSWTGRTWQGRTWAGAVWDGRTWAGNSWDSEVQPLGFATSLWSADSWS